MDVELGGWIMEGEQGTTVEISPHTGYAQDSTIITSDDGSPTDEDLQQLEKKLGKENVYRVKTKPRGEMANTTRSRDGIG